MATRMFVAVWLGILVAAAALLVVVPSAQATHNTCKVDVGLVIDRSGSMSGARMTATKTGATNFVLSLSPALDQSGLASYSDLGTLNKPLNFVHANTNSPLGTAYAINLLVASGGTNMAPGIDIMHNQFLSLGRVDAKWIMVVLADGDSVGLPEVEAEQAKLDGIEIFAINVMNPGGEARMRAIASDPDSTFYKYAGTTAAVIQAFDEIGGFVHMLCASFTWNEMCVDYPTTFTDTSRVRSPVTMVESRWNWGDGSPTQVVNPWTPTVQHTFPSPGTYNVSLVSVDSSASVDNTFDDVVIHACPVADFLCSTSFNPWLRINFLDASVASIWPIVDWQWDFGAGSAPGGGNQTFSGRSPGGIDFPSRGWYTVTLSIRDANGHTSTRIKPCFADLNLPPIIDPIPILYTYETYAVQWTVTGRDQDSNIYYFYGTRQNLPDTTDTFGRTTDQVWKWTPRMGQAGSYENAWMFGISDYQYTDETHMTVVVYPLPPQPTPEQLDMDGDGVPDRHDVCPNVPNPDQSTAGCMGNVGANPHEIEAEIPEEEGAEEPSLPGAALDTDGDGIPDERDNCPFTQNRDQRDDDRDLAGNLCDADLDGDGIPQTDAAGRALDVCPYLPNPQQDPRDCAGDMDGDGVPDADDDCPRVFGTGASCTPEVTGSNVDAEPPGAHKPPNAQAKASEPSHLALGLAAGAVVVLAGILVVAWGRKP